MEVAISVPTKDFSYIPNENLHTNVLIFQAEDLPALGYKAIILRKLNYLLRLKKRNLSWLKTNKLVSK